MDNSTGAKPKPPRNLQGNRKVSVPVASTHQKESIEDLKLKLKRKLSIPENRNNLNTIFDPTAKALESFAKKRGFTGIQYDDKMLDHFCLWDENYPENPQRLKSVIKRCNEYGLIERCHCLPSREATKNELQLVHSENMINMLESLENASEDQLKKISSKNDSIYINNDTYAVAKTAVGCTLEATKAVVNGTVDNAMALVRPPGHHAMENDYCGYSLFNNVAIAAKYAINELNVKKVMIVDWDVHHGQGTQQAFYNDDRVLYFSIHRYEYGKFWPNLREGDFDFTGEGQGNGFNINVPINEVGMRNEDYMHILHNLLYPVAYEFNPELILISAGFDATVGCFEGEMKLTPSFYAHMTHLLMGFAEGKVVAVLEGGYFMETLAESVAMTLRSLLGDPCPRLVDPLNLPCDSIKQTVHNVIAAHREYWNCFNFSIEENIGEYHIQDPHASLKFPLKNDDSTFDIMGCYPSTSNEETVMFLKEHERLKAGTSLGFPENRVCLVYDTAMEKHRNENNSINPEKPARLTEIMKKLKEAEILERVHLLEPRRATMRELQQVHAFEWLTTLHKIKDMSPIERTNLQNKYNSIYFNEFSTDAALSASGCLLQVVDRVCGDESRSGIGVIRPPGHHAETDMPDGFCLINNVAVGASYAIKKYHMKRVLILDWDIHHGNGIQNIFESNPKVLYLSIHAYCDADFYPCSYKANSSFVGTKSGRGFNVNVPWSRTGMKDGDYLSVFHRIVLPIAYEFDPELIMVSAGFDAAANDPLGNCHISPECFGHMTHLLMPLASGKMILALEGGYNLMSTSYSMTMCAKALLGDPLPVIDKTMVQPAANRTIYEVIMIHKEFWKLLYDQNQVMFQLKSTDSSGQQSPEFVLLTERLPSYCPIKENTSVAELQNQLEMLSVGEANTGKMESEIEVNKDEIIVQPEGAVGGSADRISLLVKMMQEQEMYTVMPLSWCPHLDTVAALPKTGLNVFSPCETCSENIENWVCLECYEVHCSRFAKGHMLLHRETSKHSMTLSFSDLSVWCYDCNSYIDNVILKDALAAASMSKFGLEEDLS